MWDSTTRSDKPEDVGRQEVQIIQKEDFDKQVQLEVEKILIAKTGETAQRTIAQRAVNGSFSEAV